MDNDEAEAASLLKSGSAKLGVDLKTIRTLPQNDARKQGLAWLIKSRAVVGDAWITAQLQSGHRSNISRALTRFRNSSERDVRRVKKLLLKNPHFSLAT